MKILRLQFKNLNSLYGEWEIDFTNKTFQNDSLFLLSGPTGAGKSTILDAICLALYGQTPRLGKITQSSNEIISKHTADCYALLHFETKGIQYYARFEQRRAKNKVDGKLQDVERSIAKDTPSNIICRKKTDINEEIIKITGMDFPRFTRSILLAQGAFDSFLKARDEEKSMLLEQITGTEIYSEISKAVFERAKQEKEKTHELTIITKNTHILSQEEIENFQKRQIEHKRSLVTINAEIKQIQEHIVWLNQIQELETKIESEQTYYAELLSEQENSRERKLAFLKAEKAEKLLPEHKILVEQRKELQDLETDLTNKEKIFPEQEKALQTLTAELEQIQDTYLKQNKYYEENIPLFNEIKEMDIILETKNKTLGEQQTQIRKEINEQKDLESQLTQLTNEKKAITENFAALTTWLQENQHIEALKQELSAIKQKFSALTAIIEKGTEIKNEILAQKKALAAQKENKEKQEQNKNALFAEIEKDQKQRKEMIDTIFNVLNNAHFHELKKELSLMQQNKELRIKIASLEEHRKNLQEGAPCPLCGATSHPYKTEGNLLPSQNDLESSITALEKRIEKIKQLHHEQEKTAVLIKKNNEQYKTVTKYLQELTLLIEEKEKSLQEMQKKKDQLLTDYEKQKQDLEQNLAVFHIPALTPQNAETILAELQENCTLWDTKNTEKQKIEKKLQEKDMLLAGCNAKLEAVSHSLAQKAQALTAEQEAFNTLKAKRLERFGEKIPLAEEQKLQDEIKRLHSKKEQTSQNKDKQNQEVTKIKEQIIQLQTRIAKEKTQLSENNEKFLQKITEQGFSSQEEFLNAILEQKTILQLQEFFKKLEQDIEITKKQLEENTQKLAQEKTKNLTQKSKQELDEAEKELQETQQKLLLELGDIQGKLEQNQQAIAANQENIQKLNEQRAIQEKWERLNALIGSADGKKFRTIAQAITFEHVIQYANAKLQLLQERYDLTRDTQNLNNLNLKIIDNYQGGEARAIQNLSGGESFIVSLSLALGLAQMASQNVQVDSLFLDEGFGTLDEENLDTALSTLASMQQEGKLIGVISHISLLKERITTQINIIPDYSGKSILEGTGCKKLS